MSAKQMMITTEVIRPDSLRDGLVDDAAGAYTSFEGWIRNVNEGKDVLRLEYESYEPLAVSEGQSVVEEAIAKFSVLNAQCVHRVGLLEIGECAVWVGVSSGHRDEAFKACRFIIDEIKIRLPIWKKEHYVDGNSGWVNCERCATHGHSHDKLMTR
jgi:molybdopterin synthase catalytic subunit